MGAKGMDTFATWLERIGWEGRSIRIETYADSGVNVSDVEDFMLLDGWFTILSRLYKFYRFVVSMENTRFCSILFYFVCIYLSNLLLIESVQLSNVIAKGISRVVN